MKIVRKELTPAELEPTTIRYNEDCSCVQSLVDGEWVDNPPADPRTSSAYQYPAPDTADPACDAGARISAQIERIISSVFDAVSIIEAVSTMIGVVAVFFPPIALFVALLFALISAANAIGFAAVQLSFTDMVYEQIACLVYCNIGADGQFNEDEWNAFQDGVGATFGLSTVTTILSLMFNGMGMVAFNNMASAGSETGDCTDCMCAWCYLWDFEPTDGSWLVGAQGSWSSGTGWLSQNISPAVYDILIYSECSGGCAEPMTTITIDAEWAAGASIDDAYIGVFDRDGGGGYTPMDTTQTMTAGRAIYVFNVAPYGAVNALAVNLGNNNDLGGSVILYSVKAEGISTEPTLIGGEEC